MWSLLCTLIIDAHEWRDVANFDLPSAYLHAEMSKDKRILMNLKFFFVIMCQVNPEYKKHVRYENGKKMYILVIREIHDCIESELLWYSLL